MNKELAADIIEAAKIDQRARFLGEEHAALRPHIVYLTDAAHSYRIRGWIRDYGYPSEDVVGAEAMHAFWLLVQHQDLDRSLAEDCLENCVFSAEDHAFLVDRVNMRKNTPQLYGTQFHIVDGKRELYPIESPENVDERRVSKGMKPLADYLEEQD